LPRNTYLIPSARRRSLILPVELRIYTAVRLGADVANDRNRVFPEQGNEAVFRVRGVPDGENGFFHEFAYSGGFLMTAATSL
jgi:hypothetical protein